MRFDAPTPSDDRGIVTGYTFHPESEPGCDDCRDWGGLTMDSADFDWAQRGKRRWGNLGKKRARG